MAIYFATFTAVAVTAAQDVFEITAAGASLQDARVKVREIRLGQYTDFGDAAAEIISVQVIRGYTVAGTGGTAVTPVANSVLRHSADSTVKANNTTVANTGTAAVLISDVMNIAAGWIWQASEDFSDVICLAGAERLVVRITAPADSITMNGTIVFEEC